VRVTYDPDADAAFVHLTKIGAGEATSSTVLDLHLREGAIIAVFDHADHLVGIEILGGFAGAAARSLGRGGNALEVFRQS
jgi:uncharacterized protein YuzE